MATLLWQRDISSDVGSVKTTFSSWDQCMSKTYCKWPAIIAIIIAVFIVLSLIWCVVRCICGAACCCCECFTCCASLCPTGRRRGYRQQPPPPQPYQYQSAPPPMYAAPQYTQPYEPVAHGGIKSANHNVDSLPAMPSWENSRSARAPNQDVEMDRLNNLNNHPAAPMIPPSTHYSGSGDLGMMGGAGGFNADTSYSHQQYSIPPAPYDDPYAGYSGAGAAPQHQQETGYSRPGAYAAPPSYHSRPPSTAPPTWRDV